jgi:hypothetical protein
MNKLRRALIAAALAIGFAVPGALVVRAQVRRPYRNGSVWQVNFIRMKPGMETAYLTYIASDWKREQEAEKKAGLSLSYKVLQSEPHNAGDFNLILMTEYKDLATLEANEAKQDALLQTVTGDDAKQRQGYKDRLEIREVLAQRLAREIVLEPRP